MQTTQLITEFPPDSSLSNVRKGKRVRPRRVMVYGVHAIGKSTFAASAPSPIFIPTEDGLDDIDCESFPCSESWLEFRQNLVTVLNSDHTYQTLVIDSADWLERLIWDQVTSDEGVGNIEDIGYAKGYTKAVKYWEKVITACDLLRERRGMTVIVLAHSKIEKVESPETDNYDRYSPKLHRHACAILCEWVDELLFACYEVHTRKIEEGFGKKVIKSIGEGRRVLRTSERPFAMAKSRLEMPYEINLDWQEYASYCTKPAEKKRKIDVKGMITNGSSKPTEQPK